MTLTLTFNDWLMELLHRAFLLRSEPEDDTPAEDPSRSADYCHSHGEDCDAFKTEEE